MSFKGIEGTASCGKPGFGGDEWLEIFLRLIVHNPLKRPDSG
jgi:hypothetical protein